MRDPFDDRSRRSLPGLRIVAPSDEGTIGVFIVAPYPSARAGLRALVEQSSGVSVLADSPDEIFDSSLTPDVLLVDLDPGQPGLVGRLRERYPDALLVLLLDSQTTWQRLTLPLDRGLAVLTKDAGAHEIIAGLQAGLAGLVTLDPLFARVQGVGRAVIPDREDDGDFIEPLTERERQVLALLALGLPNKSIAAELGISEHTAKFHVGAIMSKLGAASRTEAVATAARRGILVL